MPAAAASHPGLGVLSCAAQPASLLLLLSRLLIAFRHESPFTRAHLTFRLSAPLCVSAAVSEALSSSPLLLLLLFELEGSHLDVLINIVFRSQVYDYNPSLPTLLTLALPPAPRPSRSHGDTPGRV